MLYFAGRIPGRAGNDLLRSKSEGQEFTHEVQHVFHACVHAVDVKVRRNGIGEEALLNGGNCDAPGEAATAVPDIEYNASFAAFPHAGIQLAVR